MNWRWTICILSGVLVASCSKDKSSSNNGNSFTPVYSHVVLVILENHSYTQIVGNNDAPFINQLIGQSHTITFSNSHGVTHPSQPNYICLYSGSNQGVTSDFPAVNTPFTTANLGASLIQKGFTFKGYCEDLPSVGYTGIKYNNYVRPLNPWVNWQGAATNGIPAEINQPFSSFVSDLSKLPNVSIIIPDLLHNMHDGSIADSDKWLKDNLSSIADQVSSTNNLFILTFDEDDDSPANHILTLAISGKLNHSFNDQNINHYNLLRTIEDNFKLPYAGSSADSSSIKVLLP
ncbi:MAG: alkaline phosphatase family protein [Flavisolibacter sp.]